MFLDAHRFAQASLLESYSLLGTDNVRGQISEHIFVANANWIVVFDLGSRLLVFASCKTMRNYV